MNQTVGLGPGILLGGRTVSVPIKSLGQLGHLCQHFFNDGWIGNQGD